MGSSSPLPAPAPSPPLLPAHLRQMQPRPYHSSLRALHLQLHYSQCQSSTLLHASFAAYSF